MNLAIMQNMWVRDPERVRRLIELGGESIRRRMVHAFLFAGCLSGRRIKSAFNEQLLHTLHFDEASPHIGGTSGSSFPPDVEHVGRLIDEFQPKIIVTFGKIAASAVPSIYCGRHVVAPHPAARHASVVVELSQAAQTYAALLTDPASTK